MQPHPFEKSPFRPDTAYMEVPTDLQYVTKMLAEGNARYYLNVTNEFTQVVVNGTRDIGQRRAGTVEYHFDRHGKFVKCAGWNDEVPEIGSFWARWQWIVKGRRP